MPSVTCPRCGQRLTVSEFAPPTLTCPRCLARGRNPYALDPATSAAAAPGAGTRPPPPLPSYGTPPRRVIPLEYQAHRDERGTVYLMFAMAAIFGVGAFLSFNLPTTRTIGAVLAAGCITVLVAAILQLRYPESEAVQQGTAVVGLMAAGCLKIGLIIVAVVLLLIGGCFVLVAGSGGFR
jgi:hypothetical protein